MKEVFHIYREGGKTKASALLAFIDTLEDGGYTITVEGVGKRKIQAQNSYLHVLFTIAAKMMNAEGFGDGRQLTKDRVKAYAKVSELYPMQDVVFPGGVVKQVWKDTHELTKEEAMETIDWVIRHFAEEHGIILPHPGEQIQLAA